MITSPEIQERERRTAEAFADPQVGDRFEEMLSFWMFVIAVEPEGRVAVMMAPGGTTLPRDGEIRVYESHGAYRAAFAYGSIPGYWVSLAGRGSKVKGWFTGWPEPPVPVEIPVFEMPTTYTISALPLDTDRYRHFWLRVQRFDNSGLWYVGHGGEYLTAAGEWTPDKALAVRTDRDAALRLAREAAPNVRINGRTAREVAAEIGATT